MAKTAFAIGSTSVILPPIRGIVISTGLPYTAGAYSTPPTIKYTRQGAAPVTITPVSQTAGGGWVSGGFCHMDAGDYRLDAPNAAFVAGVQWVAFTISGIADVIFDDMFADLAGSDPRAAISSDVNVTSMANDVVTGAALATSAVTEMQGGIATQVRDAILIWAPITGVSLAKIFRVIARFFTTPTTGRVAGTLAVTETHVDTVDGDNVVVTYDANGNITSVDTSAVSGTP